MKALHYDAEDYDAEGDILTVTFDEENAQPQTGIELSDNIIVYYNPETEQPLQLIMLSYQAMLAASANMPIVLDGLSSAPPKVQTIIIALLERAPMNAFLQLIEAHGDAPHASRLQAVFTPDALQVVSAA